MAQEKYVELVQVSSGGFRLRVVNKNSNPEEIDYEVDMTVAQWKAILDIVGVAASVAGGTANSPAYTPILTTGGSLSPTAFA